jgi:hypothetical protein
VREAQVTLKVYNRPTGGGGERQRPSLRWDLSPRSLYGAWADKQRNPPEGGCVQALERVSLESNAVGIWPSSSARELIEKFDGLCAEPPTRLVAERNKSPPLTMSQLEPSVKTGLDYLSST